MCAELESVAGSNDPENPPLAFRDTLFLRRQARSEELAQRIAAVGALQPCRCRIRSLLIAVPVIP